MIVLVPLSSEGGVAHAETEMIQDGYLLSGCPRRIQVKSQNVSYISVLLTVLA